MHRKTGLCENCIVISLEDFAAVHEMRRLGEPINETLSCTTNDHPCDSI